MLEHCLEKMQTKRAKSPTKRVPCSKPTVIKAKVLCEDKIHVLPWDAKYSAGDWDDLFRDPRKSKKKTQETVKPYFKYPKMSSNAAFKNLDWTAKQKASFKRGDSLIVTYVRVSKDGKRYTVDEC